MEKQYLECTDPTAVTDNSPKAVENDPWGNQFIEEPVDISSFPLESQKYKVPQLRITDQAPEIAVKFGHAPFRYEAHHLKTWEYEYGAFYQCHGPDCLACRARVKKVPRRVEFFYRPVSQEIVYRAFTEDRKPDGFQARLARACAGGYPAILVIQKNDRFTFNVTRLEHQQEMDYGVEIIRQFLTELQQGRVDFTEIMPEITVSDLAQIREVETVLIALGLMQ